jgi:hypothetical protein
VRARIGQAARDLVKTRHDSSQYADVYHELSLSLTRPAVTAVPEEEARRG